MTTLHQALQSYFETSGFDEATYTDTWVDVPLGPLRLRFPNVEARRRVVWRHDLDHALTGYDASLAGEGEISAFEVAGGGDLGWAGLGLDLLGFAGGVVRHPVRTFRAFVRGSRGRNFHHAIDPHTLLHTDLETVRQALGVDTDTAPPRLRECARFVAWALVALIVGVLSLFTVAPLMLVGGVFATVTSAPAGNPAPD